MLGMLLGSTKTQDESSKYEITQDGKLLLFYCENTLNEEIIAPPLTTAVPATIKTPKSSPTIIFIVFLTPIVIPIARESVIQRPGVIDITKNTGIKKYNSEKSNNIIDI